MFDAWIISGRVYLYENSSVTSDEVDSGYYPPQMTSDEVDSGYYLPQMERRDWSDSFIYVTIFIIFYLIRF